MLQVVAKWRSKLLDSEVTMSFEVQTKREKLCDATGASAASAMRVVGAAAKRGG